VGPGVAGALIGAVVGVLVGVLGARALHAGLDRQIAGASPEDARKFTTIRRLAGPIVIATTIVEIAIVGYVAAEMLAG